MFKISLGFLIGIGVSVLYYDYGLSPVDLAEIIIKNGNDIVQEVQDSSTDSGRLSNSIVDYKNYLPKNS